MLQDLNLSSVIVRIGLSLFMGGILGAERGLRKRPAGFMTYILVCIGSALIMMTNQYLSEQYQGTDPARLGSQVVSGIGFLGAGTIIVTRKEEVRGLTTAAGLWVTAGLGIAVGAGFYSGAMIGFLGVVFAMINLKQFDIYIKQHARNMEIYLEYSNSFSIRTLSEFIEQHNYELFDLQRGKVTSLKGEYGTLIFSLEFSQKTNHQEVIQHLYTIEGVEYVREIA